MTTPRRRGRAGSECVRPYKLKDGTQLYRLVYRLTDPATGLSKQTTKRGFRTEKEATAELQRIQSAKRDGSFVRQDRQSLQEYADEWLDGIRVKPSTLQSYRKNGTAPASVDS